MEMKSPEVLGSRAVVILKEESVAPSELKVATKHTDITARAIRNLVRNTFGRHVVIETDVRSFAIICIQKYSFF